MLLKRAVIFVHRWLGVALALIFFLWFSSGIVMMYWTFPEVSPRDRLARAPVLNPAAITLSAADAAARLDGVQPAGARLGSFDGRPVYRFSGGDGDSNGRRGHDGAGAMVFADDGTVLQGVTGTMIDRAAAEWAGRPLPEAIKASIEEVDQWTVASGLRTLRPLLKYSWPDGQQVYVDARTAEVVQYTTTASRLWAYLGAIPHWLYFTPLRKHQEQWFSFVVWSSGIGTIAALLGLVIAVWMYSPRKRYRYGGAPTAIPYRGWKRWHMIAGLIFGITSTTWVFSGLLSMGPFPILDRLTDLTVPSAAAAATDERPSNDGRDAGREIASVLSGHQPGLEAYSAKTPAAAIASLAGFDVRQLELTSIAGEPVYLASNGAGGTRLVPVNGEPMATVAEDRLLDLVRRAAGDHVAEARVMDWYDAYYLDRHGALPLPVVYVRMDDAAGSRYYIDPKTARIVGSYNARRWVSRWLYHGLHSLDFPWLYRYRPLWDIVVITLMAGGTFMCVTSLVLVWRVLARKAGRVAEQWVDASSEDLAPEVER